MNEKPPVLAPFSDAVPLWDPPTADQHVVRRNEHDRRNENAPEPTEREVNEHLVEVGAGCELVGDALLGYGPSGEE